MRGVPNDPQVAEKCVSPHSNAARARYVEATREPRNRATVQSVQQHVSVAQPTRPLHVRYLRSELTASSAVCVRVGMG